MSHTLSGRQWAQTQQRLARQSSKQDSYLDPILSKPIVLPSISTKSVTNVPYVPTGDPEDRIHFILRCPALSETRDRHQRNILAVYPEYDSLYNHLKVTIFLDSNACVYLECDRTNLEVAYRNFIYSIHCHRTRILNTAPA